MTRIKVRPLAGPHWKTGEIQDTGIDQIMWDDPASAGMVWIGVAERRRGAILQLIANALPDAVIAAAKKALDDRDLEDVGGEHEEQARAALQTRQVDVPPTVEPDAADEVDVDE